MAKKSTQETAPKQRNFHKLMHLRGEINLNTRSESLGKKKFNRKDKHKAKRVEY